MVPMQQQGRKIFDEAFPQTELRCWSRMALIMDQGLDGGLMKNNSSICDGLTLLVRNKVYRSLMVIDNVLVVLID